MASLLLHCGSRSELESLQKRDASPGEEAALPEAGPADVALPDASSCTPAPAGGIAVGSFSLDVISIGIAVAGSNVYAGTAAISHTSPLYVGAVTRVPASGGATQPLMAPSFNFGSVASDGARIYYPQSSGMPQGSNGAVYEVLGLASLDTSTGAVHAIATQSPPRSTSSNINSYMIAATTAAPGVFWLGAPVGAAGATSLSAWDPATDAVTTLATGQDLRGIAVDATSVYWADAGGGQGITVYSVPLGGGPPFALAKVPGGTHGELLGISRGDVVFVSDYATGSIETVRKSGGPVRHLVNAASSWVNSYGWVDDATLYWTVDTAPRTLNRIPVAGGAADVVPTQGEIQSLAFDACNLYVGTIAPTQVFIRPKT